VAEVTNELIYEVLKPLRSDMAGVKEAWHETTAALNAQRTHLVALHQDAILARHDGRLARIERRLEITEPA
jgi:hypothetical protein